MESFQTLTWVNVKRECHLDEEATDMVQKIRYGFPEHRENVSDKLKNYWHFRNDMYELDGIPLKNGSIYIPRSLRKDVMETLHATHQSTDGMKRSAWNRFFWKDMYGMISQKRVQCRQCNESAPSQPGEEMVLTPPPTFSFENICLDFFDFRGNNFLVQVDRYSGWLNLHKMQENTGGISLVQTVVPSVGVSTPRSELRDPPSTERGGGQGFGVGSGTPRRTVDGDTARRRLGFGGKEDSVPEGRVRAETRRPKKFDYLVDFQGRRVHSGDWSRSGGDHVPTFANNFTELSTRNFYGCSFYFLRVFLCELVLMRRLPTV